MSSTELRIEPTFKRIRGLLAGQTVFDTTRALMVWEVPYYPTYFIPLGDITAELEPTTQTIDSKRRGRGDSYDVTVGGVTACAAAVRFAEADSSRLRSCIRFDWEALDGWLEEDEPVYGHARDPYTRIDILQSSRKVVVSLDGTTVAESVKPVLLFETHLPIRYYLPMGDVRMDLLATSDTTSHCPYKGEATYWSMGQAHRDIAWMYRAPYAESQKIAGLISFYNERVDLRVDGVDLRRPRTKFS